MKNIADHVLDIVQNSIDAGAKKVQIELIYKEKELLFTVEDDGKGMDEETLQKAKDPFFTTRSSRKVGLGLALLQNNCEKTGGNLQIRSKPGEGTKLEAVMQTDSIDRIPKGDIAGAVSMLICNHPSVALFFYHQEDSKLFETNSTALSMALHPIPLDHPTARKGVRQLIESNILCV